MADPIAVKLVAARDAIMSPPRAPRPRPEVQLESESSLLGDIVTVIDAAVDAARKRTDAPIPTAIARKRRRRRHDV
ncbi:MAG: hypothetical protein ACTHU0_05305 [Kofleriaceae bacterium]